MATPTITAVDYYLPTIATLIQGISDLRKTIFESQNVEHRNFQRSPTFTFMGVEFRHCDEIKPLSPLATKRKRILLTITSISLY